VGTWESTVQQEHQPLLVAPCILERGTADCTYGAVDQASPAFSLSGMQKFASSHPDNIVIVADCPDNSKPNGRCKRATADALPPNVLYDLFSVCAVHKLHGIVSKTISEDRFAGHIHATQLVLSIQTRRNALITALHELLREELRCVPGSPPQEFRAQLSCTCVH